MHLASFLLLAQDLESAGIFYALKESDSTGKVIVAILLLINLFSITSLLTKLWELEETRRNNTRFLQLYRNSDSLLDVLTSKARFPASTLWQIYRAASQELQQRFISNSESSLETHSPKHTDSSEEPTPTTQQTHSLHPAEIKGIRAAMDQSMGESVLRLEHRMSFLASTVSGAPFLGLLGTVWGVMNTFGAIARTEGAPNLHDMSPGICAALLTTVCALIVAIPAMFGYNYVVTRIRTIVAHMENFHAELLSSIERTHVDHNTATNSARSIVPSQDTQSNNAAPTNPTFSDSQATSTEATEATIPPHSASPHPNQTEALGLQQPQQTTSNHVFPSTRNLQSEISSAAKSALSEISNFVHQEQQKSSQEKQPPVQIPAPGLEKE